MFIMHSLPGGSFRRVWIGTNEEGFTVRDDPTQIQRSG